MASAATFNCFMTKGCPVFGDEVERLINTESGFELQPGQSASQVIAELCAARPLPINEEGVSSFYCPLAGYVTQEGAE